MHLNSALSTILPPSSVSTPCPVCNSEKTLLSRADVIDFEYSVELHQEYCEYRCTACDSEFLFPRPSEEQIRSFYPLNYHAYHDDHGVIARVLVSLRSGMRARYYQALTCRTRIPRIFDVGAGDCRHFDALKRHGQFDFVGVEIKPEIADKARKRGYDIETGTLESMDISRFVGTCDVVSMNHVIEHVSDPSVMAIRAFELLKPGGVAVGQLPSNSCWEARIFGRYWAGYHFPRHLQCFSRMGLKSLLERAGFVDVKVTSAPHLQSALSLQNALIGSGWRPEMKFGKVPIYSLLLLLVVPLELLAYIFGQTGIINFEARRPS